MSHLDHASLPGPPSSTMGIVARCSSSQSRNHLGMPPYAAESRAPDRATQPMIETRRPRPGKRAISNRTKVLVVGVHLILLVRRGNRQGIDGESPLR
jgi:hypothetical protein